MRETGWETGGAASVIGCFWRILLAGGSGLVKGTMSKRGIIIGVVICLVVVAPVGAFGYLWFTKNHPAVGVYTMEFPKGTSFKEGLAQMELVMESDKAVRQVVQELDLVARYKLASEDEAVARVRERLRMNKGEVAGRVRIIYLDRKQEFAQEILEALHQEFIKTPEARMVLRPTTL